MNLFEESYLYLSARLKKGQHQKLKDNTVEFLFKQTGGKEKIKDATETLAADGQTVSTKVEFPEVKDDEDTYKVSYKIKAGRKNSSGPEEYVIFPKVIGIRATHKVDGNVVPCKGFWFKITAPNDPFAHDSGPLETDDVGEHDYMCSVKAIHTFEAISPWTIDKWTVKKGRIREALVSRKPYTAEIIWQPKEGKKHKQYVNLPLDPAHPELPQGSKITLKTGAKGDKDKVPLERLGIEDDEIFVEVKFGDDNSKRNDPLPRLIVGGADIAAEPDGTTFKSKVKLGTNGDAAEFEVELGYAGGDTCEIKVGVTEKCEDETIKVTNWRKISMVMIQPQYDVVSSFAVFNSDGSPGMSNSYVSQFKKACDKVFLEFSIDPPITYAAADIPGNAAGLDEWLIHDGKFYGLRAGKKVFSSNFTISGGLRAALGPAIQEPNSFITCWQDFLYDEPDYPAPPEGQQIAIQKKLTSTSTKYEHPVDTGQHIFKYDPVNPVKTLSVTDIAWRAVRKNGDEIDVADVTNPGHPHRDWDWVAAADFDDYIEHVSITKLKLKLPAANPTDPGSVLNKKLLKKKVHIELYVELKASSIEANAGGWHGFIDMSTMADKFKVGGLVSTLLHELGHNLGQAYADKTVDGTYGSPPANAIPGIENHIGGGKSFPDGIPVGYVYGNPPVHTGTHCAFGISPRTSNAAAIGGQAAMKKAKCVMYGAGDMNNNKLLVFCEKCEVYVKAQDASDLTKHWEA